jgi:hypothetical protein
VPEQRALSATASAHDNERLTAMDGERNVLDYHAISEFADEIANFDHR